MVKVTPRPRCRLQLDALEDRLTPVADMVVQWNEIARAAVLTAGTPGPAVARVMAITQAAVYDSVNALDRSHEVLLVDALAHPGASREAAVAAAAHRALVAIYPGQIAALDVKLAAALDTIPDGKAEDDGVALGRSVADQVLAIRQNDGSGVVLPPYLGSTEPGQWRPTLPSNAPGLLPQFADMQPFVMTSPDQFRPAAPPALDDAVYTAAFDEVKDLGSATSATRTADQTAMARFWANGAGTASSPGHLNLLAQIVAQQQGNTLEANARLFAALNIAMADAVISCWDTKYEFNLWRPITGIREAAADGNSDTAADPAWTPLLGTPNFPAYTSGHSMISGAAATVLADFFGTDDVSFTLPSQNLALPARSFTSFSQAAQESADSRLYGGIHWRFDNEVGLDVGAAVGEYVTTRILQPVDQVAAAGVVNGELIVVGTDGRDSLKVKRAGPDLTVWANGEKLGRFDGATSIVLNGGAGDDRIQVSQKVHTGAVLYGGAGDDVLKGGSGDDALFGGDGRDMLMGRDGNDVLDGGDGDDFLYGGSGADLLSGGPGDDWLFGGPGEDDLDGGTGNNHLFP